LKTAIIGANGQLGNDLQRVMIDDDLIPLSHEDIEITEKSSVFRILNSIDPDLVISTAAYHNVLLCEENPIEAFRVNGIGSLHLAEWSAERDRTIMFLSTDYVFDGGNEVSHTEESSTNPLNVYGNTKLAGEKFFSGYCEKYYIIRTSGLYGLAQCRAKKGRNFVRMILHLTKMQSEVRVTTDETLTPTYTLDLANQIRLLADTHEYGLYHITNEGQCSWFEFAQFIFDERNIQTLLNPADSGEFETAVRRPSFSVLENKKLKDLGINKMPSWQDALRRYLEVETET